MRHFASDGVRATTADTAWTRMRGRRQGRSVGVCCETNRLHHAGFGRDASKVECKDDAPAEVRFQTS